MAYNQILSTAARQDTDDSSFFDGVTDFMQYGITSALTSGIQSMANTGLSLANTFGADYDYYDTQDTLTAIGLDETAEYYAAHKESLDTVGFIATSLIPGGAGVKAVRAALRGGASSSIKLVSGLSEATNKTKYVQQMTDMVKRGATQESIATVKRKAIASGYYRNAVEAAAAETAIAFTMNQAPSLQNDDVNYFSAVGNYMTSLEFALGAGLGAGIGGTMDWAGTHFATKKVQSAIQKEINNIAKVKAVGELKASTGDKTAVAVAQYKKLLDGDVANTSGDLNARVKDNVDTQAKVVKDSLLELTKGDTDIAQPLFNMLADEGKDVEQAAGMFAGARSVSRPWRNEELLDVKSVPSKIVDDTEFEGTMMQYYKEVLSENQIASMGGDEGLKNFITKEYASTEGIALRSPRSQNFKFFSMARSAGSANYRLDSADESMVIKTLRHEMGHLTADHLETLFTKTKVGRTLSMEGKKLSRLIDADRWVKSDRDMALVEQGKITGKQAENVRKFRAYLESPRELMAEAFAVLDDAALYEKGIKLAPKLAQVMQKNKVLRDRFGANKKIINLATGESTVEGVQYTVADLGPVTTRGSKVLFGRDGNQVIDAAKPFKPSELSPEEASAYWYAWMRPDSKLKVQADEIVNYNDLPRLTKAAKMAKDGELGEFETIQIRGADGSLKPIHLADVAGMVKDTKGRFAEEMRGAIVDEAEFGDMARARNYNEIARILDVDRQAAQFGSKNSNLDDAVWSFSEVYDPNKPLHAIARYERNTLDAYQAQGMISVNDRIRLSREHADSLNASYFKDFGNSFPDSGYSRGTDYNPAADISSADFAGSALGSVQGEYFHGTSFFQHVGGLLDNWTKKRSREITDTLAPVAERIKGDSEALTELSVLDSVLRRDHYIFMPDMKDGFTRRVALATKNSVDDPKAAEEAMTSLQAVMSSMEEAGLADLLTYSGKNQIWTESASRIFNKLVDDGVTDVAQWRKFMDEYIGDYKSKQVHRINSEAVSDFWHRKVGLNDTQTQAMQRVKAAKGQSTNARSGRLYPGSYDTSRMPFVAYVSDATEKGLAGHRSVGIIGATDEAGLRAKMQQVEDRWGSSVVVTTRAEKKRYLEFQGRYDRQSDVDDLVMDAELRKNGIAFDALPEPDEQILTKYLNDSTSYEDAIARNHVEVKYGEELAALRNYGREAADISTSKFGFLKSKGKTLSAWEQQEKVMLNINNTDSLAAWRDAQNTLDEKFSRLYSSIADAVTLGRNRKWNKESMANLESTMKDYGFRGAFDQEGLAYREMLVNAPVQTRGVLSGFASRANGALARLMLRADSAHGLVNAMSLPIMLTPELKALRGVASKELDKILDVGGHVRIPGSEGKVLPTNAKVMMQATKDFFSKREVVDSYIERGLIPANVRDVLDATDGLVDFGKFGTEGNLSKAKEALLKVEDIVGKPTDFSEQFTHFVAARSADLLLSPAVQRGAISEGTKLSAMQSFMRRVNGNYVAAQRPQLFQGWAGQAIGLFQTYQMNMMYNMFRYMGQDKRAAATLMAAQTTIFGTQSLPGFDWLNQKVLERTQGEADFYTAGSEMFGDEATEWGLYGLASNFTKPLLGEGIALHTRGNLDPRTATIIPTSLDEVPAVSAFTNFFNSVGGFATNVANGAPVDQAFYHAMAHNGLNRPLQGLGTMLQDGVTARTSGNLMAGVDQLDWWESATRLMGAKPLDEAIAMENFYRMEKYKTQRAQGIKNIGGALKEKVRSGDTITGEDMTGFMQSYVQEGGSYGQFETWMLDRMVDASQSQVNTMRDSLTTTEGRYLQRMMNGGVKDL